MLFRSTSGRALVATDGGALLTTSADSPSGNTLSFASVPATGVQVGYLVSGTNIPGGATVTAVGSGSVTISASVLGDVPSGTTIRFDYQTYGLGLNLDNVIVNNAAGDGIYIGFDRNEVWARNLTSVHNGGNGLTVYNSGDHQFDQIQIGSNVGYGLYLNNSGNFRVDEGAIYGNQIGVYIYNIGGQPATLQNMSFDSNQQNGLAFVSNNPYTTNLTTVANSRFAGNSQAGAGLYSDILLISTKGQIFNGIQFYGKSQTKYLIETSNPVGPIHVAGISYDTLYSIPYTVAATNDFVNVPLAAGIISGSTNTAFGANAAAGGDGAYATGTDSFSFGSNTTASAAEGIALGNYSHDHGVEGAVYAHAQFAAVGDGQVRFLNALYATTTSTTGVRMTADGATPASGNTLNMQANSSSIFPSLYVGAKGRGEVADVAVWRIDNLVVAKGASNSATTILNAPTITKLVGTGTLASLANPAIAADTTNGGVSVTVTGIASTTVDWMMSHLPIEWQ